MRIAVVHSFYASSQPSGENVVVNAQVDALRRAGHDVHLIATRTDNLKSQRGYAVRSAARIATGRGANPLHNIERLAPDVVHVHNLFPNFGASWMYRWDGAVVQTLHNFRTVCAAGTLYRDGHDCTACPSQGSFAAIRHRCYRDSAAASLPLAIATRASGSRSAQLDRPDCIIALAPRSADTLMALAPHTVPGRMHVVPNFVTPTPLVTDARTRDAWLFAGRLTSEKGIVELLQAWPQSVPLDVVGSGPLADECARASHGKDIRLLGQVAQPTVAALMHHARALVFPSKCREGAATVVYMEALAAGTPTLAIAGNAVADDVEESGAGLVLNEIGNIATAIDQVEQNRESLSVAATMRFQQRFTEDAWLRSMESVYRRAIDHARVSGS